MRRMITELDIDVVIIDPIAPAYQRTYDRIVSQADRPIRIVESEAARFGWLDFYRLI